MSLLGPEGFAEVGTPDHLRAATTPRRGWRRSTASRSSFPSGFFKEFVVDFGATGKTVAEINRGLARTRHLRRQGPVARLPRARPERALLRHRGAREGRPRPARRRRRGGGGVTPRRYHAAVWDEPLVMELGAPGRRGVVFGEADPASARSSATRLRSSRPEAAARSLPRCRSSPSPRCCATTSISRRRRSG